MYQNRNKRLLLLLLLQEGRIPKRLRSDSAKDFTSEKFQKYVKSKKHIL